jgi:hypothetical protein
MVVLMSESIEVKNIEKNSEDVAVVGYVEQVINMLRI